MASKRKSYRRRARAAKRIRRRSSKKRVSRAVKKYVKATISSHTENKELFEVLTNLPFGAVINYQGGVLNRPYIKPMVPQVQRGSANHQRIGNQIRVKKCFLRGFMNMLYPGEQQPITAGRSIYDTVWVRYCIVRFKREIGATIENNDLDRFFKEDLSAGNQEGGFFGDMRDIVRPINKEEFHVYMEKKTLLRLGIYDTYTNDANGNLVISSRSTNTGSGFSKPFMASATKNLKRVIQFTDTNDTTPTNRQLFFMCWCAHPDSDGPPGFAGNLAELHFTHTFIFEDQ